MANALTAVRLLLVFPFAFFMAHGDRRSAIFALLAWVVALITDFPVSYTHLDVYKRQAYR